MIPLWRQVVYNFLMAVGCGAVIFTGRFDQHPSYWFLTFLGFIAGLIGWLNGALIGHAVSEVLTKKISKENWEKVEAHVNHLNGQIKELEALRKTEGEEWKGVG